MGNKTIHWNSQLNQKIVNYPFAEVHFDEELLQFNENKKNLETSETPRIFILKDERNKEQFYKIKKNDHNFFITSLEDILSIEHNVFTIDENDLAHLDDIIKEVQLLIYQKSFNRYLRSSQNLFGEMINIVHAFFSSIEEKLLKTSSCKEGDGLGFFISILDKKIEAKIFSAQSLSLKSFEDEINRIYGHGLLDEVKVLTSQELLGESLDGQAIILPLVSNDCNSSYFLAFCLTQQKIDVDQLQLAILIVNIYELFFEYLNKDLDEDKRKKISILEDSFHKITIPIAMISDEGQLILYNKAFSILNFLPRECLQLSDGDKLERNSALFLLQRKSFEEDGRLFHLFIFKSEKFITKGGAIEKRPSSEELGIISSSIAHELKNPLAGILATLDYLELLEDWSDELSLLLKDLKESVIRSKDLVDIFLGLSKASSIGENDGPVDLAFSRALDLLRFRMIESGVYLNMSIKIGEKGFYKEVNLSVVTIIFYLILNEILTRYAHFTLVSLNDDGDNDGSSKFDGLYRQMENKIELEFFVDFSLDENMLNSRLLKHLFNIEKLSIDVEKNKIIIRS